MTDTIKPELGKTYLTRDGRKARCICTDMQRSDGFPVICLVDNKDSQVTYYYMTNGRYRIDQSEGPLDLVSEAPRVVTVEVWVEVTPKGEVIWFSPTRSHPPHVNNAVVKITQDVELSNV